jgi:Mrp family chromosome partitioning ATPase
VAGRTNWTPEALLEGVRSGDRRALARAITLVENSDPLAYELVRELYPETGKAYALGVTGPPGVGKSSLISALVRHVRSAGRSVGVISVDPSSPFTGGAILGEIVHRVTGKSIRDVLAEEILTPLGFRWTNYGVAPDDVAAVGTNYLTGPPVGPGGGPLEVAVALG